MSEIIWSDEQNTILDAFADPNSGHFLVDAMAGTGKTTVCMEGIRRAPERKRGYTVFNVKNKEEAAGKIKDPTVEVLTLNGLGHRYVRAEWFGARPDDGVERDRIKTVLERDFGHLGSKYAPIGAIQKTVAFAKNTIPKMPSLSEIVDLTQRIDVDVDGYCAEIGWDLDLVAEAAVAVLKLSLMPDSQNRISFNDQLWLPVVKGWVRPRFDLLVIDETQDMSPVQLKMVRGACRGRLVLVGDENQALYGFRGADVTGMSRMAGELKAKRFPLTITRRCPKAVVARAARLVPGYRAAAEAPEGVVRTCSSLDQMETELRAGDAVVSRVNAPLAAICLALLRRGTPAYIEGRDFAKDLVGIVESVGKGCEIEHFLTKLDKWEERKLARITRDDEAAERKAALVQDQAETIRAFAESCHTTGELVQRIQDLFQDSSGVRRPSVVLSSTHRAKGLEWNRVYVLMAGYRIKDGPAPQGEGRCLTYVAWTRAKKELVLVTADWKARSETAPKHGNEADNGDMIGGAETVAALAAHGIVSLKKPEAVAFVQDRLDTLDTSRRRGKAARLAKAR